MRSAYRRALGAAAAAAALSLLVPQTAQAIIKGYEPMAAIKGKDYGKERQRSVHDIVCVLHAHCSLMELYLQLNLHVLQGPLYFANVGPRPVANHRASLIENLTAFCYIY